jgi:hypothetical protein
LAGRQAAAVRISIRTSVSGRQTMPGTPASQGGGREGEPVTRCHHPLGGTEVGRLLKAGAEASVLQSAVDRIVECRCPWAREADEELVGKLAERQAFLAGERMARGQTHSQPLHQQRSPRKTVVVHRLAHQAEIQRAVMEGRQLLGRGELADLHAGVGLRFPE